MIRAAPREGGERTRLQGRARTRARTYWRTGRSPAKQHRAACARGRSYQRAHKVASGYTGLYGPVDVSRLDAEQKEASLLLPGSAGARSTFLISLRAVAGVRMEMWGFLVGCASACCLRELLAASDAFFQQAVRAVLSKGHVRLSRGRPTIPAVQMGVVKETRARPGPPWAACASLHLHTKVSAHPSWLLRRFPKRRRPTGPASATKRGHA